MWKSKKKNTCQISNNLYEISCLENYSYLYSNDL